LRTDPNAAAAWNSALREKSRALIDTEMDHIGRALPVAALRDTGESIIL